MKKWIILLLVVVALGLLGSYLSNNKEATVPPVEDTGESIVFPTVAEARLMLVGRWQSTQDEKSVVIFKDDNSTEDEYAEEMLSSGTWEVYEDPTSSYNPSGVFLRKIIEGEAYEYAVLTASAEQLTLSYLERGNTLDYRRVAE